ncbi:hypothetical protein TEA_025248 [Camellia sinensis var. sinensis]|uniref:Proteasome subunit beta n=1 Tax=Camellia sinensis var. sinensis TaxID=542762 RepID=A0A4S4EVG9_CAMSN|nr:hypothetical protein TEA_025248 [Camellia sinensis var. sinensis]
MTSAASLVSSDDPEQWCLGPAPNPGIQVGLAMYQTYDMPTWSLIGLPRGWGFDDVAPVRLVIYPYVTGTSVIGIKFKDGILMAADMGGSYGSTLRYKSVERLKSVGKHSLLGASGEINDFQEILCNLDKLITSLLSQSITEGLPWRDLLSYFVSLFRLQTWGQLCNIGINSSPAKKFPISLWAKPFYSGHSAQPNEAFQAQALGLPFLSPYLQSIGSDYRHGANFATSASTVLLPKSSLFVSGLSPFALAIQLNQMKHFKVKVDEPQSNGKNRVHHGASTFN